MTPMSSSGPTLYTIGHSKHSEDKFLALLALHGIKVLMDVRSQPFSRYHPQFRRTNLQRAIEAAGINYLFMGDQLGGRPKGHEFYDDAGQVLYHRMAQSPGFLAGIERLKRVVSGQRVAIMCSEENPAVCHRHLLITRVLSGSGINILHIRGDGRLEAEDEIAPPEKQGTLFAELHGNARRGGRKSVRPKQTSKKNR
jgi:uncharacterized protein (DUF488 family)